MSNLIFSEKQTRGLGWPCNTYLSVMALREPDLEAKTNIPTKIYDDNLKKIRQKSVPNGLWIKG